jgi:ubiquinol-cytochrome c reductase cytochrome c1 subunit
MRRTLAAVGVAALALLGGSPSSAQEEDQQACLEEIAAANPLPHREWSFNSLFGTYDRTALRRGLQVYTEVCAACHALDLLSYRHLAGIGMGEEEIKTVAAAVQVTDGPNDEGEMFERAGLPTDRFKAPFPNEQAARAANNGALPPDLSLIAKAREGGPDHSFAILTGYGEPPACLTINEGSYFNRYFEAGAFQIAMPPPLNEGGVTYADGTPATVEQMAADVSHFLAWASEPHLETRHRIGVGVMLFLAVLVPCLYAVYRTVWMDVDKSH